MNPRLRKFLSYYKRYWKRFILVMLAALATSCAALLTPLCTQRIARLALSGEAAGRAILNTGLIMLALLVFELLTHYFFDYYGHSLGARMESDLRSELFGHLETLSFGFFDHHKVGHLMSSLTTDLLDLTELFHHGPEDYIMSLIRLIGASAILFAIHPVLALVAVLFVPVMILATVCWGRRLRRVSSDRQARIADVNAGAADILGGIRTIQTFTQEDAQRHRFNLAGEHFYDSRRKVYLNESYAHKTTMGLSKLCLISVVMFGGISVWRGTLDLPGLITFLMYVAYLTDPIEKLSWMITQFQTGMAGFDRVMTLLETEPEIRDAPAAKDLWIHRGEIKLDRVEFGYDEQTGVLNGLSAVIPAGQFTAIVGASGKGKSTLGALLSRFYEPQSGSILIDGSDIAGCTLHSLRSSIAWVQQETYLFDMTIAENIRMGKPDATDEEVRRAAELADADGFISRLPDGYDSLVGEHGVRLSGGQRQRIGIARALLKDAPVLILDEATSALDNASERRIYRAVHESRADRTTLVIAHRLSTIRDAEQIIVLENGRVAEEGCHDRLIELDGIYANLYRRQQN